MKNMTEKEQKEIFKRNLQRFMALRGISQADLSAKLDLTQSTVAGWYHGVRYPRPKNMQQIADALGVLMSDLREEHGNSNYIPVYGAVRAGYPNIADNEVVDMEEISSDMARTGEYFAVRVKGDSMSPRMADGDVLIVRSQQLVENGEIAVVSVNSDDATVKKFYQSDSGVTLVALNPAYPPLFFTPDEVNDLPVKVLGKVVELRAKFA